MKIPTIKEENGNIVLETIIAEKEINYVSFGLENCKRNPIADNQKVLIECIEARMLECYNKLNNNLLRIIGNDGIIVVYRTEEGTLQSFNMPSWKAMEDVRKALQQQCYDHYSVQMLEQLLKSIVLGPVQKCAFKDYNELVRYLIVLLAITKD